MAPSESPDIPPEVVVVKGETTEEGLRSSRPIEIHEIIGNLPVSYEVWDELPVVDGRFKLFRKRT